MATGRAQSKNEEDLRKAKVFCSQLLRKHLLVLSRFQAEIFGAIHEGFNFLDTSKMDFHVNLSRSFAALLVKYPPNSFLQRAYVFWTEQLAPAILRSTSTTVRKQFADLPKLLAAFLIYSTEYDKACVCLGHAIRLRENELTCRFVLLQWLCHLGDWNTAHVFINEHVRNQISCTRHFELLINAFDAYVDFNLLEDKSAAVNRLTSLWKSLGEGDTRTFLNYQCQVLLKHALVFASRLPSADLSQVGDPLVNLDVETTRLQVLIKNRHQSFFDKNEAIDLQKSASNVDEFLKLISNVGEFFESTSLMCRELLETAMVRECEAFALNQWMLAMKLASLPRVISCVNMLLQMAFVTSNSTQFMVFLQDVAIAILSLAGEKSELLRPTRVSSNSSVVRSSCSSALSGCCVGSDEEISVEEKEKKSGGFAVSPKRLEVHQTCCDCAVCNTQRNSAQFALESRFIAALFDNFTSVSFRNFAILFRDLVQKISEEVQTMREAVLGSSREKPFCFIGVRDMFLACVVRWLRTSDDEEKESIVNDVISDALKVCEEGVWFHRSQWLMLRQMARCETDGVSLPWLAESVDEPTDTECVSASITERLALQINNLFIQTPRRLGDQREPRSASLSRSAPRADSIQRGVRAVSSSRRTPRKVTRQVQPHSDAYGDADEANRDFHEYSHLFYREWRYLCCGYLLRTRARSESDAWMVAFLIAETASLGIRESARMHTVHPSISSPDPLRFTTVAHYKEVVQSLPNDLTVVELYLDSSRVLWVVRLSSIRRPFVVPVARIPPSDPLLQRMNTLIEENEASGRLAKTNITPREFWSVRRKLDSCLERIVNDVQTNWFGEFAMLLLPYARFSDSASDAVTLISKRFTAEATCLLVESIEMLTKSEWCALLEKLALLEGISRSALSGIVRSFNVWKGSSTRYSIVDDRHSGYTLLSISPELACFPLEMLPVFEGHKRVFRIPSFYLFQRLLSRSKEIPKCLDGSNSFYVLDPGGDLTETQTRMAKVLQKYDCWRGIIGESPKPEELKDLLESKDFFFYIGHGSGGRYFGKSTVRRSDCRAVSLLMGCSSARIAYEGAGFDGRSALHDYTVAGCPCVVGCLWMVTDGEIDRFFLALVEYCFTPDGRSALQNEGAYRLLIDAMAFARKACKLKYMTGGAVVSYGLPIVARSLP